MRVQWAINDQALGATECPNCNSIVPYILGDTFGACRECSAVFDFMAYKIKIKVKWSRDDLFP